MQAHVWSGDFFGVDGRPVEVQIDLSRGKPGMTIVGMAGKSIRESRDRIRAALANAGYRLPDARILVNLAPASEKKEGTGFDLPIALGILIASGQIEATLRPVFGALGELSLEGGVRPVQGALLVASALVCRGVTEILVPEGNAAEAALAGGACIYGVGDLAAALRWIRDPTPQPRAPLVVAPGFQARADMADVRDQAGIKRALLVAASGNHNVLLVGPPGSGKTMLARRTAGIIPPLAGSEVLEVMRIYSAAGILDGTRPPVRMRPFRSPHHSISYSGLVGGGSPPRPGEITLAHRGTLFLDELPEFSRRSLEVLRQPVEEGRVVIGRSTGCAVFPCRFQLIAAMNPCPCGYLGHPRIECRCTRQEIACYRGKVSGPLLDRIDIHASVCPVPVEELGGEDPEHDSGRYLQRVTEARRIQARRLGEGKTNARMTDSELRRHCRLTADARRFFLSAAEALALSGRAFFATLKVARTVADLEGSEGVTRKHLSEALHYRPPLQGKL